MGRAYATSLDSPYFCLRGFGKQDTPFRAPPHTFACETVQLTQLTKSTDDQAIAQVSEPKENYFALWLTNVGRFSLSPLKCLFQNRNKAAILMLAAAKRVLEYNYVFNRLVGTIDPTLPVEIRSRLRSAPRIRLFSELYPHFFEPRVRGGHVYLLVKILSRAANPKAEGKRLRLESDLASKGG